MLTERERRAVDLADILKTYGMFLSFEGARDVLDELDEKAKERRLIKLLDGV